MMQSVHLGQSKLKTNNEVIASEVTVNENTIRKRDRQADNQTGRQSDRHAGRERDSGRLERDSEHNNRKLVESERSKSRSEGRRDGNNSTR